MNKKLIISLVSLLVLLAVSLLVFRHSSSTKSQVSDITTSTEIHKLLGYYSPYTLGTTTCPAFAAPSGDVDFILNNGYALHRNGFTTFSIDLNDLSADQRNILLNSDSSEIGYVYLNMEDAGRSRSDNTGDFCESFVRIISVVPMVPDQSHATSTSPIDMSQFVGVISTGKDGQNTYFSPKYALQFKYPQGWILGDNHLGYGTFQLFNYVESDVSGGNFKKGTNLNKIEASIGSSKSYGTSDIYPEKTRETRTVLVAGQQANCELITFSDGTKALFYAVPIPSLPNNFFEVAMYGNPSNFSVLDQMVNTLVWIK